MKNARYNNLPYPKSFPNDEELTFLKLVLSSDEQFLSRYRSWKKKHRIEETEYAISRLFPLLYLRLKARGDHDVFVGRIKGFYRLAWVKNQRLIDALRRTVTVLQEQGIQVLVLKGIPLLVSVYGDIGARFLGDTDIMIHPRDARRALILMNESGWKVHPVRPINPKHFSTESLARVTKEVTLVSHETIEVDLHWRLFDFTARGDDSPVDSTDGLSFESLWGRSHRFHFKDGLCRMPSPEDMIIHSIIHGAEGNIHRTLRWVTDVVAIAQKYPIDWQFCLEYARQCGWSIDMYIALRYLTEHEFITLPESAQTYLERVLLPSITPTERRAYYARANHAYSIFGGFPRLWRTYWKYEAKGIFPINVFHFTEYLAHAWGFDHPGQLAPFILRKYWGRVIYLFQKKR